MTDSEIHAVFNRVYNGAKNLMTGDIIGYGKRGKMVWELSTTGNPTSRELFGPMFGVTVIELPSTKRNDLSQCFSSNQEAEAYIKGDFTNA